MFQNLIYAPVFIHFSLGFAVICLTAEIAFVLLIAQKFTHHLKAMHLQIDKNSLRVLIKCLQCNSQRWQWQQSVTANDTF